MRVRRRRVPLALAMSVACAGACSGGSEGTPDAEPAADARADDAGAGDAPALPDGPAPMTCTAVPDYGSAGQLAGTAVSHTPAGSTSPNRLEWRGDLDAAALPDQLAVELFAGAGVFTGADIQPGTYTIEGDELDYATCGVCVLLYTDVAGGVERDVYLATAGSVAITSVSPTLAGQVSGVSFEHVTINPVSYESTPDPDMCRSALTDASFATPVTAM